MAELKQLTQAQVADQWAKITVKIWREKLVKLKVIRTNQLWQSFLTNIASRPEGELIKIEFNFLYYGKFVDMGVGRGVKIGGVKESAASRRMDGKMLGNRRKPKKWYSPTLQHELYRLAELMGVSYADAVAKELAGMIGNASDIKLI